jgi:hypothetical protein
MFRLVIDPPAAFIGNEPIKVGHIDDEIESTVYAPLSLLKGCRIADYPDMLICYVNLDDEFARPEIRSCAIARVDQDRTPIEFYVAFGDENGIWANDIAIAAAYRELTQLPDVAAGESEIKVSLDDDTMYMDAVLDRDSGQDLFSEITRILGLIHGLIDRVNEKLFGFQWKQAYESDEPLFTKEVVIPLLRELGFNFVKYNHGRSEYGRDVLFSELDRFGRVRHYAAQVKAGDISASNGTLLNTLIAQIDDAFAMPVSGAGRSKDYYISEVYVICSGKITEGAVQRLNQKMDPRLAGSVHFLDRADLEDLMTRC